MVTMDRAYLETLFEGAPRFLDRLMVASAVRSTGDAPAPIVTDPAAWFAEARRIAHAMPEADQIELLDAHPRLGAPPGTVSALSYAEQGYDRVTGTPGDDASIEVDVAAELDRLNAAYEATFGFRYCVFVAGRPREALLPGFAAALEAGREAELRRGIDAVVDIAIDRHAKLSTTSAEAGT